MASVFKLFDQFGWAGLVVEAIVFSLAGIFLLIGFIVVAAVVSRPIFPQAE